jgi:phage tail sheath protein FI
MYKHPGVYIEHVPSGVLAIEAASTSTAALIGHTRRGDLVTADVDRGEPVQVFNASQFADRFGELDDGTGGIRDDGENPDYFGFAVNAFFANGGGKAYIVPVGDGAGAEAEGSLVDPSNPLMAFYFNARSEGAWANGLWAAIERTIDTGDAATSEYQVALGLKNDKGEIEPIEAFDGLVLDVNSGRFLAAKVNDGSALVEVGHLAITGAGGGGQSVALLGAPLAGLDLSTITAGATLGLRVNTSDVDILLSGADATLKQLAAAIQAAVRAHAPPTTGKTGFLAQLTRDDRLLLISGGGATAPEVTVRGGDAARKLGVDPTVFLGNPVASVDGTALDTQTIDVRIGATPAVTVTLATPSDLADVASQIQAGVGAAGFVAEATAANQILLRMDGGTAAQAISVTGGSARAALGLDGDGTSLRPAALPYPTPFDGAAGRAESMLAGGIDHGAPNLSNYQEALTRLRDYRDVSIILLPGRHWIEGGDNAIIEAAVTHAEFMKNRLVIVDPPNPVGANKLETPKDVKDLGAPTPPYTALYYPWLEVANPHYDPDTAANKPKTFALPPSAFAAGMWARIDGARGVWKAPAGLEATVRGSIGPNILIGNDLQDNLNEWGVNCLRAIIGPTVIWGARTLATKTQPEFRYVPVRRTQSMIGESLYLALQAVVFEPNDYRLWGSLRASTTDFMDGLHRAGAFQGEKASDAYFVRCGLGSTMTQADIDAGIVRLVVGFAPLKPAEFVIVQIKQIVGRAA